MNDFNKYLFGIAIGIGIVVSMYLIILGRFDYQLKEYGNISIQIPNSKWVTSFCNYKGFDDGWLSSSSCGWNEVMCHKTVFDLEDYKCIKI